MEIRHHGVEHSLNPGSIDCSEGDRQGIYRGQSYEVPHPYNVPRFGQPPVPQPIVSSIYRGVSYRATSTGTEVVLTQDQLKNSKPIPVPVQIQTPRASRPDQTEEATKLHRQNILRSLQRRMQVAQANGDRRLVQQLEQELQVFS
jgi:hypothetical protein